MAVDMFLPVPIDQEPLKKNRFVLEFSSELNLPSYLVKTSGKPKATINAVEIPYMNNFEYVAGKVKIEPIDISFLDVIGPSTTQLVMDWVNLHYEMTTGRMGYAVGYKKNLVLKALDPTGVAVQKWTLIGCMITSVGFGDYDQGSDDISEVTITIQPSRFILG